MAGLSPPSRDMPGRATDRPDAMEPLFDDLVEPPKSNTDTKGGTVVRVEPVHRRSDALYGTHAYHTKVPPSAIVEHVLRHTELGDLVIDPFCGSGMTGVAAAITGRRAFLNDLSPAACHIASNYTRPCPPAAFREAVDRVLSDVGEQVSSMYTSTVDGAPASVEYVVWSDIRACPCCQHEIRALGCSRGRPALHYLPLLLYGST